MFDRRLFLHLVLWAIVITRLRLQLVLQTFIITKCSTNVYEYIHFLL